MSEEVQPIEFAISYAGENAEVAREVAIRLRELGFEVFFAESLRHLLVGTDGEQLFESLFRQAREVVVFISEHYKRKEWTRFEWDVIRDRERLDRFIAVRLDDTKILGLPSNIFYIRFSGSNYDEVVKACVHCLLMSERDHGVKRSTEYERILHSIRTESKGALAEAYQLVRDKRRRDPLGDIEVQELSRPSYEIVSEDWYNFSVVRRRSIKITVPNGLSLDGLRATLKHCATVQFNAFKPDALMVYAYAEGTPTGGVYTAGRATFAPFGKWEKAQDGVAYNIPVEEFDFTIDLP